jgi:hypothetical protein
VKELTKVRFRYSEPVPVSGNSGKGKGGYGHRLLPFIPQIDAEVNHSSGISVKNTRNA